MTFFLSKTVAQSRPAGFAALGGVSVGVAIHSVLVAAGLSVLLAASATAFTILKIAGAAYLAWLAIDAIRHGSSLSLARRAAAKPLRAIFLKGLLINLLNPKIIIFFVTFLPQFVSAGDPHVARKLLFLGAHLHAGEPAGLRRPHPRRRPHRASAQALARAPRASSTGSSPACSAPSPRG